MRRIPFVVALCVLSAAMPASAVGVPLKFGPPVAIGLEGAFPAVAVGPAGEAVVAWAGSDRAPGVYVAARADGLAPFAPPVRVAPDLASAPLVARTDRGVVALAWVAEHRARVAVSSPDGRFGSPEIVPLPERSPVKPGNEGVREDSRSIFGLGMAAAVDGSLDVAFLDLDYRAGDQRLFVVTRAADGTWTAPQLLDAQARSSPSLAADGLGGVSLLWAGVAPGADESPRPASIVDRRTPSTTFGPRRFVSSPQASTYNGVSDPQLAMNRRGDAAAVWTEGGGGPFFEGVTTTLRPAGGAWTAPLTTGRGLRPSVAVNEAGDAVTVWNDSDYVGGAFRPAGSPFGGPEVTGIGPDGNEGIPIALDALGNTVALRKRDGIRAVLRPRSGPFDQPVAVSPPGRVANSPAVATDPLGNGVAAWGAVGPDGTRAVGVANYSARPPQVSTLRVAPASIAFSLDEPGRVRVTIADRRGRSASTTVTAGAARTRVAFTPAIRRLVRRSGRYRASVRARDAGPGSSTRRIAFRR